MFDGVLFFLLQLLVVGLEKMVLSKGITRTIGQHRTTVRRKVSTK